MNNPSKYQPNYNVPIDECLNWASKSHIEKAPIWCSVDLRDGNQALMEPMNLTKRHEYFKLLTGIGFKEIEVGYPGQSDLEYTFIRELIDNNLIPDDVTIQVLTQAKEDVIRKTFDAINGAKNVIIHLFSAATEIDVNPAKHTSLAESKAKEDALLLNNIYKEVSDKDSYVTFEYSPPFFHRSKVETSLKLCNTVLDIFSPSKKNKVIINLPTTMETAMPHVFASQIEYISTNLHHRENVILSLHPHNDRGCAVSDAELGILAGADRIEGTLFGNGERTGNADIVTLAMNLFSYGVDCQLDFSNMPMINECYERLTNMKIYQRQPYAGELIFTAFSDSHQAAIAKGMKQRSKSQDTTWQVPYLPIDPVDIGRTYDSDVIRINSLSGKSGISYIMKQHFSIDIPKQMLDDVIRKVRQVSDVEEKELSPTWLYSIFEQTYISHTPSFIVNSFDFKQINGINATVNIAQNGKVTVVEAIGNGRLDAVNNAIKQYFQLDYELFFYEEHALSQGSTSKAMSFVGILYNNRKYWGAGIQHDILHASVDALVVAVNKVLELATGEYVTDSRLLDILNYLQINYQSTNLDDVAMAFHLSPPYISRYVKEKSGKTFGEHLTHIRLTRAKSLLKNGNSTIENIAFSVGYPNVEHFIRTFKKHIKVTPSQYRKG